MSTITASIGASTDNKRLALTIRILKTINTLPQTDQHPQRRFTVRLPRLIRISSILKEHTIDQNTKNTFSKKADGSIGL